MYICSAATPTPNGTMCALTTDYTKDASSEVRVNSTTGFLSENRYSCTTDILSKTRDNSVTDSSSKNRDKSKTSINSIANSSSNNSTIGLSSKNDSSSKAKDNSTVTKKVLKLSISKKQHSYQEHDPPIDVNHPSENSFHKLIQAIAVHIRYMHLRIPTDAYKFKVARFLKTSPTQ